MNSFIGCLIVIGLFSNLTGYLAGYFHKKSIIQRFQKTAFYAAYRQACVEMYDDQGLTDDMIAESYFIWRNNLDLAEFEDKRLH